MAFNLDTLRANIRAERARCNISQEELALSGASGTVQNVSLVVTRAA